LRTPTTHPPEGAVGFFIFSEQSMGAAFAGYSQLF
jgi:hypothetical protein